MNQEDTIFLKLEAHLGAEVAIKCRRFLQNVRGGDVVMRRIGTAPDSEQFYDYFNEIRFALIFLGLGFEVEFEPLGKKGPDLKITRDGEKALVEIKRFRKMHPGPPIIDLDQEEELETLPKYGNPQRDIRKTYQKILDKFRQVEDGKGIIAIWNDDEDLEELEAGQAVKDICSDAKKGLLEFPDDVLFVVYGSDYVGTHNHQQLYCYSFREISLPFSTWSKQLKMLRVDEHIKCALAGV